jgi:hypothetical protein
MCTLVRNLTGRTHGLVTGSSPAFVRGVGHINRSSHMCDSGARSACGAEYGGRHRTVQKGGHIYMHIHNVYINVYIDIIDDLPCLDGF